MVPLIFDHRPHYLAGAPRCVSLLTLPFGTRSLLATLVERTGWPRDVELTVVTRFEIDDAYHEALHAAFRGPVRVVAATELAPLCQACEQADEAYLLDPARWPGPSVDVADVVAGLRDFRGAVHAVAVDVGMDDTRERVERDDDGQVTRVQRFYNGANWPEVASNAVFLSRVPARAIADIQFSTLGELRAALCAKGVLSRDVPVAAHFVDLHDEATWLQLCEQTIVSDIQRADHDGFTVHARETLVGRDCRIDPTARIAGPVILHDDVTVHAGATIIGPATIGQGARIGPNAVVAHACLVPRSEVPADRTVRSRVVCGRSDASSEHIDPPGAPALPRFKPVGRERITDERTASPDRPPRARWGHLAAKRAFDLVVSSVALVLLFPLFLAVAIAIKLTSRGPITFRHVRERRDGKAFGCVKFRTMVADAHLQQKALSDANEVDGPQFKLRDDPRVTRIGRWLRATNIDELPQLFNVWLGHMSLVGPRPSPFRENQICVPWRRARLSVRPGITGLWQTCRAEDRSAADFHEWIYYDITYVRHFSFWLDIKILLATVLTLGGRRSVPVRWLVPTDLGRAEAMARPLLG
ncbi:MAG: sugar transferase [Phycisphaerae bacterium]